MLIIGARGHAIEILDMLDKQNQTKELYFFDNINFTDPGLLFNRFPIIRSFEDIPSVFSKDPRFILGLGNPGFRQKLSHKFSQLKGKLTSAISKFSEIGNYDVILGDGLNIMNNVFISNSVSIGEGTLVNARVGIHHNVTIGRYCELSPNATILGGVKIGDLCSIGSGAILLPNVTIGENVIIGAGSVVTRSIPPDTMAYGVPARVIKKN